MPHVIEKEVTTKDEMESICMKKYRFVGEWCEIAIDEKIAEIID